MCESVMPSPPVQPIASQPVGDRRRGDDVARDDDERAPQLGQRGRPGVHGDDELLGREPCPGGLDAQRPLAREAQRPACPRGCARRARARRAAARGRAAAGWTVAARGSNTPARWRSEPARRADLAGRRAARKASTPCCSQRRRTPSQAPTCAGVVAVHRKPPRRKSAVDPVLGAERLDRRRCAATDARQSRIASSAPQRCDEARQLRPPGQRHAAVAARRAAAADVALEHDDVAGGSRSLIPSAVHRPTKPPPRIATSARAAPCERRRGRRVAERLAQPERAVSLPCAAILPRTAG